MRNDLCENEKRSTIFTEVVKTEIMPIRIYRLMNANAIQLHVTVL